MEKKFLIRGYRENADFPSLCDENPYSLDEAMNKSREYFRRMKVINKIELLEQEEADKKKRAAKITLMNNLEDLEEIADWWKNG